jgi:hypothetical protein
MVLTEIEKVMIVVIGGLEVIAEGVLDVMKTMLHMVVYGYGWQGVLVHSGHVVHVCWVFHNLQLRPRQAGGRGVGELKDCIFCVTPRVPSRDF